MLEIARKFLATLDTPRALTVEILLRYKEWDQLVNLTIDPHHYCESDVEKFKRDIQSTDLLRKAEFLPTTFDRKDACIKNFVSARNRCILTRVRLTSMSYAPLDVDSDALTLLKSARKIVRGILGPVPCSWDYGFGPGATYERTACSAVDYTLGDKISSTMSYTGNWNALAQVVGSNPYLQRFLYTGDRVDGNRFASVPKNAKTERAISIEPGLNILAQKGVGQHIRRRLKRVGIDLDHGQALHARLAQAGSRDGSWTTIDLEMASDTVTRALVQWLLPRQWFELLDGLRSAKTRIGGCWIDSECFSSMGNGFTFELETLIFGALVAAGTRRNLGEEVFVYGDDILVPGECTQAAMLALSIGGFTVNKKKTFSTSCFRESCGGVFFNGIEILTVKIEEEAKEVPDWIAFHNALYRFDGGFTHRVRSLVKAKCPAEWRDLTGPVAWGDVVFHGNVPSVLKWKGCTEYALICQRMVRTVDLKYFSPQVVRMLALYGIPSSGIQTRTLTGFKKRWQCTYGLSSWPYIPALA